MSHMEEIKIKCEKCGEEFVVNVPTSVNSITDPETKAKIMDDSIYYHECPSCHNKNWRVFPILYHDMDKHVMINSGTVEDVIISIAQAKEVRKHMDDMFGIKDEYTHIGATSAEQLYERILCLDKDLDYRVIEIIKSLMIYQEVNSEELKEMGYNLDSVQFIKDDEEGPLGFLIRVIPTDFDDKEKTPLTKFVDFDKEYYDFINNSFKDKFDKIDCTFFDEKTAEHLVCTEDIDSYIINTSLDYLICEAKIDKNIELIVAKAPKFNEGKFKMGDFVAVKYVPKKGGLKIERKAKVIYVANYNYIDCPFNQDNLYRAYKKLPYTTNFEIEDEDLDKVDANDLIRVVTNEDGTTSKEIIPAKELVDKDVIIAFNGITAYDNGVSVFEPVGEKSILARLPKMPNAENFCVFTNLEKAEEYIKDTAKLSKIKFTKLLNEIFVGMDRFFGIIINPGTDNLKMSLDHIYKYRADYTMENEGRMVEYINKLTESEINFIGKENMKVINMVYFEEIGPAQIAEKLEIDKEKVGKLLGDGYERMIYIHKCNY